MPWNERLRKLRGDRTIEEVSYATWISPDMYEAYERGDRMPPEAVKEILANYYGVKVDDIWK